MRGGGHSDSGRAKWQGRGAGVRSILIWEGESGREGVGYSELRRGRGILSQEGGGQEKREGDSDSGRGKGQGRGSPEVF